MAAAVEKGLKDIGITVSKPVLAMLCIIFGLLIIMFAELLRLIVGLFLIVQGILVFTKYWELKHRETRQTA